VLLVCYIVLESKVLIHAQLVRIILDTLVLIHAQLVRIIPDTLVIIHAQLVRIFSGHTGPYKIGLTFPLDL
jgi:hypothetical protein